MGFDWLNHEANYAFYLECTRHYGICCWDDPSDDQVAMYCMGGEL